MKAGVAMRRQKWWIILGLAGLVIIVACNQGGTVLRSQAAPQATGSAVYLPLITKALMTSTPTPTRTRTPTPTRTVTRTPTITPTPTQFTPPTVLEPFENPVANWLVSRDTSGTGNIQRSTALFAAGVASAQLSTSGSGSAASIRVNFSDPASAHSTWGERPGTYYWQLAHVYLPSSTVAQLGASEYVTIGGLWASGANYGWYLRVRQNGALYVIGQDHNSNQPKEFQVYGTFPQNRWVTLELGLHSQQGPGVKRAFAFVLDGNFFGWYHQGRLQGETYDRAAIGLLNTNSPDALTVYVDQWYSPSTSAFPSGPDNRPTANVQEKDYRTASGVQWQIDWSTWQNDLRLVPQYGLYSAATRLQSGYNLDRMPNLTSGWAEIEADWVNGATPNTAPTSWFGPMVGFRKEINREENMEVIPVGAGGGNVNLVFELWRGGGNVVLAQWPMPLASIGGSSHIPEPGDIIRVRWEQMNATDLNVRASYYDASAAAWNNNIINHTFNASAIAGGEFGTVNYNDGNHTASSVTIDSNSYSIRRFKVGVLATYPGP